MYAFEFQAETKKSKMVLSKAGIIKDDDDEKEEVSDLKQGLV